MEKFIPVINIKADSNYNLGEQIGKKLKNDIHKLIAKNKIIYKKEGAKDYSKLIKTAEQFVPSVKKFYPNLLKEAKGISDAAEVDFKDLMVLLCEEELLDIRMRVKLSHCTNVAVKTNDNKILLGHNEDWLPSYRKDGLVVMKGKFKDEKFISLNIIGNLPGSLCGLTSKKLAFTSNSIGFKKFRYGLPRSFQLRALLEAGNLKKIENILYFSNNSIDVNTIMVLRGKKIVDIEDLFRHNEEFFGKNFFIHTNHPILKKDQTKENTDLESIKRFERAKEILLNEKNLSLESIKKVLRDHKAGICEHKIKKRENTTVASVVMNVNDMWMEVCKNNPCKNEYKRYYLK